jgi:hypothetical protein
MPSGEKSSLFGFIILIEIINKSRFEIVTGKAAIKTGMSGNPPRSME